LVAEVPTQGKKYAVAAAPSGQDELSELGLLRCICMPRGNADEEKETEWSVPHDVL
jgi:hypothetical protein